MTGKCACESAGSDAHIITIEWSFSCDSMTEVWEVKLKLKLTALCGRQWPMNHVSYPVVQRKQKPSQVSVHEAEHSTYAAGVCVCVMWQKSKVKTMRTVSSWEKRKRDLCVNWSDHTSSFVPLTHTQSVAGFTFFLSEDRGRSTAGFWGQSFQQSQTASRRSPHLWHRSSCSWRHSSRPEGEDKHSCTKPQYVEKIYRKRKMNHLVWAMVVMASGPFCMLSSLLVLGACVQTILPSHRWCDRTGNRKSIWRLWFLFSIKRKKHSMAWLDNISFF